VRPQDEDWIIRPVGGTHNKMCADNPSFDQHNYNDQTN